MTALQQIIKEAKILRKKNPKMEWKKAVAQASAIYSSKHKGKSPVGKKHKKVARKKAAKKVGTIKRKVVRKKTAKKRITERGILNRIHTVKRNVERLDEAQHKHMLGKIKAKPTIIALAKKIRRQTDMNEHNLAILSLAKFLKEKKSIELINNVIKMHNNYGYMPKDLINIRDTIYAQLMITLKHKYGQVDYKEIEHSF
jgi:hypothetical protein